MCNGRFDLTVCTSELAWKHKSSNALVSVVADSRGLAFDRHAGLACQMLGVSQRPRRF